MLIYDFLPEKNPLLGFYLWKTSFLFIFSKISEFFRYGKQKWKFLSFQKITS